MKNNLWDYWRWLLVLGLMWLKSVEGIRFDFEYWECLMYEVEVDGEFVYMFVKVVEEFNFLFFWYIGVDVVVSFLVGLWKLFCENCYVIELWFLCKIFFSCYLVGDEFLDMKFIIDWDVLKVMNYYFRIYNIGWFFWYLCWVIWDFDVLVFWV